MIRLEEMIKELKVVRRKMNVFICFRISVKDICIFFMGIGYVFGWGIIMFLIMVVCLCDVISLLCYIRYGVY